jgi:pSer/pThr/pTyr-binding forkhead associated (FHA) protein
MPRIIITVPEKKPQPYRFQLDRQMVSFGRGSENDIPIDSGSVSVKHAEMHRIDGGYELRDMGSTNGIKLEGNEKKIISLKNGALVKIGDVEFDFVLSEDEIAALALETPKNTLPPLREIKPEPEIIKEEKTDKKRNLPFDRASSSLGRIGKIIIFLIIATAAFVAGMNLRKKGRSVPSHNSNSPAIKQTSSAPKPAEETAPAAQTLSPAVTPSSPEAPASAPQTPMN